MIDLIEKYFNPVMAVADGVMAFFCGLIALFYLWGIYYRKLPLLLLPGPKLMMIGFLFTGIGLFVTSVALSHSSGPPKLPIVSTVFFLSGSVIMLIGSLSFLRSSMRYYYRMRKGGRGNIEAIPHLP